MCYAHQLFASPLWCVCFRYINDKIVITDIAHKIIMTCFTLLGLCVAVQSSSCFVRDG